MNFRGLEVANIIMQVVCRGCSGCCRLVLLGLILSHGPSRFDNVVRLA